MAEDDVDEDESFGDFHFVSFPTNHHPTPTQINGRISDSFGGSNNRVGSDNSGWVKPRGAIPLSIFGEEEEEEEGSGVDESRVGDSATVFPLEKKKKKPDLEVHDLIAGLYNRDRATENRNGSAVNSNGSALNVNGSDSNGNNGFIDVDDDDDDDDGWEFKAAELESGIGNGDSKLKEEGVFESPGLKTEATARRDEEIQVDAKGRENTEGAQHIFEVGNGVHGPSDFFTASNGFSHRSSEWSFGFDFNMASMNKQDAFTLDSFSKSKDNDIANVVTSSTTNKKVDSVENFWDFKDAFPKIGSQHKLEEPKIAVTSPAGLDTLSFDNNGFSGPIDLFAASDGLSQKSGKWDSGFNFGLSSVNGIVLDSYSKSKQNDLISSPGENDGASGNFWEFKDAFSESGSQLKSVSQEEPKVADNFPTSAGVAFVYDVNGASNPKDSLVASDGVSHKSGEWEVEFNFNPTSVTQDDIIFGSYSKSKQNDLKSSPVDENDEFDENFGEFKDASSETGSKHEEVSKVADYTPSVVEVPAFSDEIQRNEVRSENHKEPLPMSIFSDGKLESDDSSILQDISSFTPTPNPKSNIQSPDSNISINDLISTLYSQAEQHASVNNMPKESDHETHSTSTVFESDLGNSDDFDDDSWDFKDAISGTRAEDQTSDIDLVDSQKKPSSTLELNDCVDFFCKLKGELCSIALCHLDNLKKAQSTTALSGEEAKAKALDEEIQKFYNELHEDNLISEEDLSEHLSQRNIHFNELLEVLQEPKFRVLESEYELSRRLSLAEKDIRSAIDLLKEVASAVTILKLGSAEERQYYVSTWSKILSVCAQELKHGALIWKESLQKNVQSQILSEPQGKRYILALGEIYRVVEVLRASTKIHKPWLLLTSTDIAGLVGLLGECYSIWSSSGIEDALKSISDCIDFKYDGTIKALLESIEYIHDIDTLALQNHAFSGQQPICHLSALSASIVPGLSLVVWNGEHYFLTLANLWANLINCDPPKLPQIHGS
ncbi:hypothetical protein CMV_029092 [Castanea mollissima]|uniref:Synergin gamma C-terminal domain-containing protein n=1 Tax=Castanea mollissima TaxID=60419 RepID=A0A8J4QF23_9ROSI|nr:hypothetical protein CMV_029092 [Castanea mollissima]